MWSSPNKDDSIPLVNARKRAEKAAQVNEFVSAENTFRLVPLEDTVLWDCALVIAASQY